jgi:uncharacterized protein YdhG (YjbR/CyaY superfamily)
MAAMTLAGERIKQYKKVRFSQVSPMCRGRIKQIVEGKVMAKMKSDSVEPGGVDEYIETFPKEVQGKLQQIRAAIQDVAPGSTETVSYFQIPGYSYEGYDYNGMFAWFSYKRSDVRLHVRPPVIQDYKSELAGYATTKAIVSFPSDKEVPIALVKKLVKASIKVMKDKSIRVE